jgi:hypothetical protein
MSSAELDPTGQVIARSPPTSQSSGQGSDQFNQSASDVFRSSWNKINNKFGISFGSSSAITEGKDFFL